MSTPLAVRCTTCAAPTDGQRRCHDCGQPICADCAQASSTHYCQACLNTVVVGQTALPLTSQPLRRRR